MEQQSKFIEHQRKLEEQHRAYLEQQQKYYEEHHKFLEQQQNYKPPPVVYTAPPTYVPPPTYYRGPAYAGKSHSKSPTRARRHTVGEGDPLVTIGDLGNGPSNVSAGGMYTSRNQKDGDAYETTSRMSRNSKMSKNSKLKGIKGISTTSQGGWNTHTNKIVSAEEEQMKIMA